MIIYMNAENLIVFFTLSHKMSFLHWFTPGRFTVPHTLYLCQVFNDVHILNNFVEFRSNTLNAQLQMKKIR